MKIAYCARCSPAVIVAVGALPSEVVVKGRKVAVKPPSHISAKGETHESKFAEVKDAPRIPGEELGAYLKRLADLNRGVLV